MPRPIQVVSLLERGPAPYRNVLALQKAAERCVQNGGEDFLFLLEHTDVITLGRNAGPKDLLFSEEHIKKLGIDIISTDRGGKLTFHGPGQLVAYPVMNLAPGMTDVRKFVWTLEEAILKTVSDFAIEAARSEIPERWSSVWVKNDKLAAIGVHLSRWVTTHGMALNVSTELPRFSLFIPCGIKDGGVTSMKRILGERTPPLCDVAARFTAWFSALFEREPVPAHRSLLDSLLETAPRECE